MKAAGTHILLDMTGVDRALLDSRRRLREILVRAAENAGATVLDVRFRSFLPSGVTGVVLLSESHIAIHTWPGRGYAAVDLFTCGKKDRARAAARGIVAALAPTDSNVIVVARTEPGGTGAASGTTSTPRERLDTAIKASRRPGVRR